MMDWKDVTVATVEGSAGDRKEEKEGTDDKRLVLFRLRIV
jgi:hypothetical protein